MDQETTERLLIDHALGALSPDVSALLAEHSNADDRAQWRRVADLARASSEQRLSIPLPAMPRRHLSLRYVVSLAAILLFGIGIGLWLPRTPAPAPGIAEVAPAAAPIQPSRTIGVRDFWSTDRLVAAAMEQPKNNPSTPRWTFQGGLR